VVTAPVTRKGRSGLIDYCVVNDLASLMWVTNLANIELHSFLSLRDDATRPTMMVFDLDPGPPAGLVECARVALLLRNMFALLKLEAFVKTSGGKGMQVYVPLNSEVSYADTKAFARRVAQLLERQFPQEIVFAMKKTLRAGKVFIDWSQNTDYKTTVCVYSLRARDVPSVSTPLAWHEVQTLWESRDVTRARFTPEAALQRVTQLGDLFAPVLSMVQELPAGRAIS
jgi:bifunctional non-homologous end joining protein LigD